MKIQFVVAVILVIVQFVSGNIVRWSGQRCETTTGLLQSSTESCVEHCNKIELPKFDYGHCILHNYYGECQCIIFSNYDMTSKKNYGICKLFTNLCIFNDLNSH